jgi:DNA polymerase III alpha subunit
MMRRAAEVGMPALAIADVNAVAGIVRAHVEAREIARTEGTAPRLIPAARVVLRCGLAATVIPQDRVAGGRLCRLLTAGRRRAPKGECYLGLQDLIAWGDGQLILLHPPETAKRETTVQRGAGAWGKQAERLARRFAGDVVLAMAPAYDGQDRARFDRPARLAGTLGIPTVAAAAPLMHHAARRRMADVLAAIRLGCRVEDLGRGAVPNAEARLRSGEEMLRLFAGHKGAVRRAGEIAARALLAR